MKKFLIVVFFFVISLTVVESGFTERIYSHFDRLPLMREEAVRDRNERAITDIDYVQTTPEGEYFEVDNGSPPIETVVTKRNKTKQRKPLESKKDEDLLVEYYKRVEPYAEDYTLIRNYFTAGKIGSDAAAEQFKVLSKKFPTFSSAPRAAGAVYLSQGRTQEASKFFKAALEINARDPVALTAESLVAYAQGKKSDSRFYVDKAREADPKLSFMASWELHYIQRGDPHTFRDWETYIDLR